MLKSVSGAFWSALEFLRAGSMAAPGGTRSGATDAEVYASSRTNHGSAHPLVLDVGKYSPTRRVIVDGI